MSVVQRRRAIGELVECVFVKRGWGRINERAYICFRGEAPVDLPVRGTHHTVPDPFDTSRPPRRPKMPRRWSRARIEEKLSSCLGRRTSWPPPEEFIRVGQGPLFAQLVRTGGPEHWAVRMGVDAPRKKQGIRAWNEALAARTLRNFVKGRKSFPSRHDFSTHGYRGLYNWLQKHGGLDHWAGQVRVPRR
jgi:hypothetical protein